MRSVAGSVAAMPMPQAGRPYPAAITASALQRGGDVLQTITKIGPMLDLFTADRQEWGVTEAAEGLGIPRSSAHGMLTSRPRPGC